LENGLEEKLVWVFCWKHASYLKSINSENGLEEKLVQVFCWKHTSYVKSINCLKSAAIQQLHHLLWLTVSALISFPESFAAVIS
jgi:hypothetical protein